MADNHFRCDAAEARSYGTNEPHRESTQRVAARPSGANYIPDATGDQVRLEASMWAALAKPYDIPMHPFGIVRTKPTGDGLTVEIDGIKQNARSLITNLLPWDNDGHLQGTPRLRARWNPKANALEFRLQGTRARVLVTGLSRDEWTTAVQELEEADEMRYDLLDLNRLRPVEEEELRSRFYAYEPDLLASRLLRRAAAFHTLAAPYAVDAWRWHAECCDSRACTKPGWAIEMFYSPSLPFNEGAISEYLTGCRTGVGLKGYEMTANVIGDLQGRGRAIYMDYKTGGSPCQGILQIRFRTWWDVSDADVREQLKEHGHDHESITRLAPLAGALTASG